MIWAGCGGYVGHCDIVAHCDIAVYSLIITGSSEICHGDALGVGCVIFPGILHRALGIGTCRALNGQGDVIVGSGVSSSAKLVKSMVPRSLKSSDRSWIWIGFTMRSSRNWSTWVTSGSVAGGGGGGGGWGWVGGRAGGVGEVRHRVLCGGTCHGGAGLVGFSGNVRHRWHDSSRCRCHAIVAIDFRFPWGRGRVLGYIPFNLAARVRVKVGIVHGNDWTV